MTERFVEQAQANMGAIERLLKGLPGISGYVDKELRRDADKRLRESIAGQLTEQKQALFAVQKQLLSSDGLRWLDDVDQVIQKVQTLADRIRTASYGYAGFFDAVKIREEQLAALHQFDVDLASRIATIPELITALRSAKPDHEAFLPALQALAQVVQAIDTLFNHRREAILSPELLTTASHSASI